MNNLENIPQGEELAPLDEQIQIILLPPDAEGVRMDKYLSDVTNLTRSAVV